LKSIFSDFQILPWPDHQRRSWDHRSQDPIGSPTSKAPDQGPGPRADQVRLPVHGMGPSTQVINWLFAAPKLKRLPCSLWKSITGAWLNVRPGLRKSEPTIHAELLRQPVFGNPLITNQESRPLGFSGRSKGNTFASAGYSKVRDFWDLETQDWKSLSALWMNFHPSNM